MIDKGLVSIIMLSQNKGRFVRETVDSVLAQSYQNWELLFVDDNSKDDTIAKMKELKGKARVNHQDMLKCYWPAYLTVMYDAEKVGRMSVRTCQHNDYALWLNISDKHDFYLLPEKLASLRTTWNHLGRFLLTNNTKWRYDAYRIDEDLGPMKASLYTIRNGWFGLVKWFKYVKRTR